MDRNLSLSGRACACTCSCVTCHGASGRQIWRCCAARAAQFSDRPDTDAADTRRGSGAATSGHERFAVAAVRNSAAH
jgi:hypothetical protein